MGKAAAQSPDRFKAHRFAVGSFICDICGNPFPIDHLVPQNGTDGISSSSRVGRFCCWEPSGTTIERDLREAYAAAQAARLTAKESLPPSHNGETYYGTPTVPESFSFVVNVIPDPIVLTRGGVAVAVSLVGNNFATTDTISYGSTGITDASAPVLVSDVSRTLSVQASALMGAGRYSFTFNGTKWPQLFDVR